MRIEPHENLSVWSFRHDHFWFDRYSPVSGPRERLVRVQDRVHTHVHEPLHVTVEPVQLRDRVDVVHETRETLPTDCHPCGRDGARGEAGYVPYMSGTFWGYPGEADTAGSDEPGVMRVVYDKAGISRGTTHGQSFPSAGSMLDVFA